MRFAVMLLVACSPNTPDPLIVQVIPGSGTNVAPIPVQIEGANLDLPITSDVDRGDTVVGLVTVRIGGVPLEDVRWRSDRLIEGTIPPGLVIGTHDVTVELGTRAAELLGGFVVEPAVLGAFDPPMPITAVNTTGYEDDPSLTGDLLELYFERDMDIWVARRASTAEDWGPPVIVPELNSAAVDNTPEVLGDGLVIYFSSARPGAGGEDIYVSSRPDRASAWGAPVHVAELATAASETSPHVLPSQLVMYFSRGGNILRSARATTSDPWGSPTLVAVAATSANEYAPWVDATETHLFVTSDMGNPGGLDDLWVAERATTSEPFGPLMRLDELSSPDDEEDPWLSPDLRYIVFASDRSGNQELYFATR